MGRKGDKEVMLRELTDIDAIKTSLRQPEAFAAVFDAQFQLVHRYLHRRVGEDLADDLAAETFVQAFRTRHKFQPSSDSALPWLYGIASKLLMRHRRKERRRLRAVAKLDSEGQNQKALGPPNSGELPSLLAKGLLSLKGYDREALLLYAWAELSYAEIAQALSIPVGTVRSRINRARQRIREALEGGLELQALATSNATESDTNEASI